MYLPLPVKRIFHGKTHSFDQQMNRLTLNYTDNDSLGSS